MAEAILFGHRALQPHRRPPGGAPEGRRQGQAHPVPRAADRTPSSTSPTATDAKRELVVIDVETTGTDPKMSDLVEVAAVKVKGTQDRRPLVDVREPRPTDRRQPDARHHRQGRQGRAQPEGGRRPAARLRRRRAHRRPQRRLRPRLHRGGQGRRVPRSSRARYLDTLVIAREGYPGAESYKLGDLARFFGVELDPEPSRPAGRRGDRQPAALVRERPAGSDLDPARRRSPTRSVPSAPVATPPSCSRRPAARRASARACSA